MENKTIQEQIKESFEKKLYENILFNASEIEKICELLYQKMPADKAADLIYKIIGGDLVENTST